MEELTSFVQLFLIKYFRPFLFESLDQYFSDKKSLIGQDKNSLKEELALLNSSDVCAILKCNRHFLYDLIRDQKIKSSEVGGRHMFRSEDVKKYIDSLFEK